jgi:hypothetical protein
MTNYTKSFGLMFFKNMMMQDSIIVAFNKAKQTIIPEDFFNDVDPITMRLLTEGVKLLPKDASHREKLFDDTDDDIQMHLKDGPWIDTSNVRGPSNVELIWEPFVGR